MKFTTINRCNLLLFGVIITNMSYWRYFNQLTKRVKDLGVSTHQYVKNASKNAINTTMEHKNTWLINFRNITGKTIETVSDKNKLIHRYFAYRKYLKPTVYGVGITYFLGLAGYAYGTQRTETIKINRIESLGGGNKSNLLISGDNGKVYRVANSWFYLQRTAVEIYYSLKENETYKITVFGFRFNFFYVYPKIIKAVHVKKSSGTGSGSVNFS